MWEVIGQGLLERLSEVAQNLHGKLNLSENEPLTELIIAGYLPGYGPDIWTLTYQIQQQEQDQDYWTTRVLRPSYLQFWPPEKGQPRTLLEFSYPSDHAPTPLLELLRQKDPRIEQVVRSDPKMAGSGQPPSRRRKQQSACCRRYAISSRGNVGNCSSECSRDNVCHPGGNRFGVDSRTARRAAGIGPPAGTPARRPLLDGSTKIMP